MQPSIEISEAQIMQHLPHSQAYAINTTDIVKKILGGKKWEQGLKSIVNKHLYALEKKKEVAKIDGTPPLWYRVATIVVEVANDDNEVKHDMTYVYVDVDNTHCLQEVVQYASSEVNVVAYASPAYNHFIPEVGTPHVLFEKLSSDLGGRDAADVMFCMHMSTTCIKNRDPLFPQQNISNITFIIASKDKSLSTAGRMHAYKYGVKSITVTDGWEDLRTYLE
jgi:hypothetical protein